MTSSTFSSQMIAYAFSHHRAGHSSGTDNHTEAMVESMLWFLLSTRRAPEVLHKAGLLSEDEFVIRRSRQQRTDDADGRTDITIACASLSCPEEVTHLILELKVTAPLTARQVSAYRRDLDGKGRLVVICPNHERSSVARQLRRMAVEAVNETELVIEDRDVISYDQLAGAAVGLGLEPEEQAAWQLVADFVLASRAPSLPLADAGSLTEASTAKYYFETLTSLYTDLTGDRVDADLAKTVSLEVLVDKSLELAKDRQALPTWSVDKMNSQAWFHIGGLAAPSHREWKMGLELDPLGINGPGDGLVWYKIITKPELDAPWVRSPSIGHTPQDAPAAQNAGRAIWAVMAAVVHLQDVPEFDISLKSVSLDQNGASGIKLVDKENPDNWLEVSFDPKLWAENPALGPIFLQLSGQAKPPASMDTWEKRNGSLANLENGMSYLRFVINSVTEIWQESREMLRAGPKQHLKGA